jgi:transcriptional regulator CtsR
MKNHYAKVKLKNSQKLLTPLHSMVYANLPEDQLITADYVRIFFDNMRINSPQIIKEYINDRNLHKSGVICEEIFKQLLDQKVGFVEVFGQKLDKLVKT